VIRKPVVKTQCASPEYLHDRSMTCELSGKKSNADHVPAVHCTCGDREHHALARSVSLDIGLGWMQVVKRR
jgi:hypothetical protein